MWLVIGYGSTLRSDDRFGPEVAAQLAEILSPTVARVEVVTQLLPEWIEPISQADGVVFIDASQLLPPGHTECSQIIAGNGADGSIGHLKSHHCDPRALLDTAQYLYGHAPPAWLYSVGGLSFETGKSLSEPVLQGVACTVRQIAQRISGIVGY